MAGGTLRFVVEVAADQAQSALKAVAVTANQTGVQMRAAMLGVGSSAGLAKKEADGLFGSLRKWSAEQGQQARVAGRIADGFSSLAETAGVSSGAIRGFAQVLIEGAAGGISFGLALESAQLVGGVLAGVLKRAEENAKRTAAALKLIQDRIDAIGKTPIQQKMEEFAGLGDALREAQSAEADLKALRDAGGTGEFGASITGAEEERAAAAKARLAEYAAQYKVDVEELPKIHARVGVELNRMESQRRTELETQNALANEKAAAERLKAATKTADDMKRIAVEAAAEAQREIMEEEIRLTVERVTKARQAREAAERQERDRALFGGGSPGEFSALESATGGFDNQGPIFERDPKSLQREMAALQGQIESVAQSFANMFMSIIDGSLSAGQALAAMGRQLVSELISLGIKKAAAAIASHLTEKPVKMGEVSAAAGVAGAEAAASVAGIPIVGPILALEAMAATSSAILSSMMPLAAAAGGWDLPVGGPFPTLLHSREMVLPEKYANVIRDMDGKSGRGGLTLNITTMDAKSFEDSLSRNDSSLLRVLRRLERNGRL